jgi:hypothetical protein
MRPETSVRQEATVKARNICWRIHNRQSEDMRNKEEDTTDRRQAWETARGQESGREERRLEDREAGDLWREWR